MLNEVKKMSSYKPGQKAITETESYNILMKQADKFLKEVEA